MPLKWAFDFSHVDPASAKDAASGPVKAWQGDFELLLSATWPFYASFVREWPFPGDPTNPESYEHLTYTQVIELTRETDVAFDRFKS